MITLHRLGHDDEPFQLNPDLIVTIEATPDTVLTLATAAKVVVAETVAQVSDAVRDWRVSVLSLALRNRREPSMNPPSGVLVGLTAGRRSRRPAPLIGAGTEGSHSLADQRGR